MNWKKTLSIPMVFLLTGGMFFNMESPMISDAKSIYESNTPASYVIQTFSTLNSKENDSSDAKPSESNTSAESTESSSNSGSDSSNQGNSNSSEGSSSSGSDHSDKESNSGDSNHSDSSSNSDSSASGDKSDHSSDSNSSTETNSDKKANKNPTSSKNDQKKNDINTEKKVLEKKIEKDDSNGRDYQESEVISSGNTSFTIVSVVREDKALEKKLKELKEKKKELTEKLKSYEKQLVILSREIEDIQNIYNLIYNEDLTFNESELYLTGYKKEYSFFENQHCLKGMDAALYDLAHKYHNEPLLAWLENYSTERSPYPKGYTPIDINSGLVSNVDSLLQEMLLPCTNWIAENQTIIDNLANGIEDAQEHIDKLNVAKAASAIDIDSRLVEYKDKIPDQCIEFLNAIVAKEGTPYVWGADGPNSFDCSGLISYGLRQCDAVSSGFRWTSIDFASQLRAISFSEAKPGDLVWKPGHIAVYIDDNTVFEAPYTGAHIRFTSCNVSSRFSRALRWWTE